MLLARFHQSFCAACTACAARRGERTGRGRDEWPRYHWRARVRAAARRRMPRAQALTAPASGGRRAGGRPEGCLRRRQRPHACAGASNSMIRCFCRLCALRYSCWRGSDVLQCEPLLPLFSHSWAPVADTGCFVDDGVFFSGRK